MRLRRTSRTWKFTRNGEELTPLWTYDIRDRTWIFCSNHRQLRHYQAQLLYLALRLNNSGFCDPVLLSSALRGNLDDTKSETRPRTPRGAGRRFAEIATMPSLKPSLTTTLETGLRTDLKIARTRTRELPCARDGMELRVTRVRFRGPPRVPHGRRAITKPRLAREDRSKLPVAFLSSERVGVSQCPGLALRTGTRNSDQQT